MIHRPKNAAFQILITTLDVPFLVHCTLSHVFKPNNIYFVNGHLEYSCLYRQQSSSLAFGTQFHKKSCFPVLYNSIRSVCRSNIDMSHIYFRLSMKSTWSLIWNVLMTTLRFTMVGMGRHPASDDTVAPRNLNRSYPPATRCSSASSLITPCRRKASRLPILQVRTSVWVKYRTTKYWNYMESHIIKQ